MATTSATAQAAAEILQLAGDDDLTISVKLRHDYNPATRDWDGRVIDATVTVERTFTPGDAAAYIAAESAASSLLGRIPMTRAGSVWGTDSGSVGGHAGLSGGYMRLSKSGCQIRLARALA
jgi:hypothetical protein